MSYRAPIRSLGRCIIRSPLTGRPAFVPDDARVLDGVALAGASAPALGGAFERAGPRARLYFDPSRTTAGILTAGGVCPGINDVVRGLVVELRHRYGVRRVLGFRFGFGGLEANAANPPIELTTDVVRDLHTRGGTFLGTSRGLNDVECLADGLRRWGVDILFTIGGDGTMRATHALASAAEARSMAVSLVAMPKTIDNDIPFVDKTFGFDSAVTEARRAIDAAHAEARSSDRGVGLVRLMGRNAGFIAAQAALASHDVNACLVPEVPFRLSGPGGLLAWLEDRLEQRRHAVIVVAEGCAKQLVPGPVARDASGNDSFSGVAADAGLLLRAAIEAHFRAGGRPISLKYIDPSYMLRARRATAEDAVFCDALARHAVHAAMAGKTDLMVGRWHRYFTHVALVDVLGQEKRLDPDGELWAHVLESTGQPGFCPPATRVTAPALARTISSGAD